MLKVTTSNPIVINSDRISPQDEYLNAHGECGCGELKSRIGGGALDEAQEAADTAAAASESVSEPSRREQRRQAREGNFWNRAKGTWEKARDSGALDFIAGLLNQNRQQDTTDYSRDYTPVEREKEGMKKGTKIALVVGGVALVGTIIYLVVKNKKGK
jgi:hypothetical protein